MRLDCLAHRQLIPPQESTDVLADPRTCHPCPVCPFLQEFIYLEATTRTRYLFQQSAAGTESQGKSTDHLRNTVPIFWVPDCAGLEKNSTIKVLEVVEAIP